MGTPRSIWSVFNLCSKGGFCWLGYAPGTIQAIWIHTWHKSILKSERNIRSANDACFWGWIVHFRAFLLGWWYRAGRTPDCDGLQALWGRESVFPPTFVDRAAQRDSDSVFLACGGERVCCSVVTWSPIFYCFLSLLAAARCPSFHVVALGWVNSTGPFSFGHKTWQAAWPKNTLSLCCWVCWHPYVAESCSSEPRWLLSSVSIRVALSPKVRAWLGFGESALLWQCFETSWTHSDVVLSTGEAGVPTEDG